MLEASGATVLRYPLVTTREAPDRAAVEKWLHELAAGRFDDVIVMTAEGLVRLGDFARRAGIDESVKTALGRLRTIARGPKACRALRDLGILPTITLETPTTDGLIDALRDLDLEGHTLGLQLCGQDPNPRLVKYLEKAGAAVRPVAPYVYDRAIDDDRAFELIHRMAKGSVDTITFTSSRQIDRLFEVAESRSAENLLRTGLGRTRIAAVGPVAAATLRRRSLRVDIVPESSFFLRSLVHEVIVSFR